MDALVWVVCIAIGVGGLWIGGRGAARRARDEKKKP